MRKATISPVMFVGPSVRIEKLGSHSTDLHKIWYLGIFKKSVEEVQVSLEPDKNNRSFIRRPLYIYDTSRNYS
jgi:hypothetical protein